MRKPLTLTLLAAALAASVSPLVAAPAATDELTLDRIYADPPLAGRLPRAANLSPAGQWLTFLQPSEADSEVMELWGQPLPAGKPRRLLAMSDLIGGAKAELTEAEKMALERRRIQGSGILSYQWCGEDDKRLLVPMSGALYAVELNGDAAPKSRKLTEAGGDPAREPQCDKAGRQVAFVKGGDLYVQSLNEGGAKRLTLSGSKTMSTGLAEFIAEEELDRHKGFWWSPDGKAVLAIEVDESPVPIKVRAQIFADRTAMTEQRYPGAGQPNAKLRALNIDVASGSITPLPLPTEAEYIARAGWFADGKPWLQWLTRDQTRLDLVEFDGGKARTVLSERDPAWVELHNDLRELPAMKLSGHPALLWSSERSGRRQLWLLDRVSGAVKQLTQQPEMVAGVVCAADKRIVFSGVTERGRGKELFETDLNGKTRMIDPGQPRRTRGASGDSSCQRLLMSESSWGKVPTTRVISIDGKAAPIEVEGSPADPLLARIVPEQQVLDIISADGKTPLNATYSPPLKASASGKNPVIVQAYGGPHGASVGWRYSGGMALEAYWQRLGFGVMTVDTRGMANRDRDFTHAHYRAIGKIEVADLFAAVRQLPKLVPSVDPARIGFTGWSYGGFLAARSMLDTDTPFAAAFAGAPPTDWTLYDTAYTERYLGIDPQGGKAPAYAEANLIPRAKYLSKPLMLIHGTADDNVLFENSLKLIEALQNEGKIFETTIYPGKAHGIAGRKSRLHLAKTQTDFFVRHLKP
ncbi:DPP IV N-terminal domain-containing protein [Paucibacter sp. JuS9]|uniref:S9 family peptidase n=1 Tax=Roseateles TaxID=93681 RepID=UPI002FE672AB